MKSTKAQRGSVILMLQDGPKGPGDLVKALINSFYGGDPIAVGNMYRLLRTMSEDGLLRRDSSSGAYQLTARGRRFLPEAARDVGELATAATDLASTLRQLLRGTAAATAKVGEGGPGIPEARG